MAFLCSTPTLSFPRGAAAVTTRRPRTSLPRASAEPAAAAAPTTPAGLAKGARVRVKADVELYVVGGYKGEAYNVNGLEGVVFMNVFDKWGPEITSTKPYQVKFTDPKFMAHFDEDELELIVE